MKEPEYIEGPEAKKNFEEGMKALFKVPKDEVVKAEKKKQKASRALRLRKPKAFRQGLEGDFCRFPRPCRFVARRFVFACSSVVG